MYAEKAVPMRGLAPLSDDGLWSHPWLVGHADLRADSGAARTSGSPATWTASTRWCSACRTATRVRRTCWCRRPGDPAELVVIDLSFRTPHPLGFDLSQLLVGLTQAGEVPAAQLPEIAERILASYLDGVHAEGVTDQDAAIRDAFVTVSLLRSGFDSLLYELLGVRRPCRAAHLRRAGRPDPLPRPPVPGGPPVNDVPALRRAALGGYLAVVAWFLQPLLVFALVGDEDRLTWESLEEVAWTAPYETVVFCLIGLGFLLLVDGLDRASGRVGARIPVVLGWVGGLAWFVAAAFAVAPFTSAATDIEGLAVSDQTSVLALYGVVQMAVLVMAMLGHAAWLGWLAVAGSAQGLGVGMRAVLGVCAVTVVAPLFVPFGAPWGALAVFVAALVLAVRCTWLARRARANAAAEPDIAAPAVAVPVVEPRRDAEV